MGSTDSVHYLERNEVNGLKLLQRQQRADRIKGAYVFINERGMSVASRSWQVAPSGLEYRCRSVPRSNIGAIVRQTQIGAKIVSTLAPHRGWYFRSLGHQPIQMGTRLG